MTDTIATDVWARWELANGVWNYTDLPTGSHYPTGKTGPMMQSRGEKNCFWVRNTEPYLLFAYETKCASSIS